ncbi:MAG: PilN domain-containing protein [Selenomonadaceae bacterium]|nr:PilN domain-containing protein [Selenomonadaceae bacterium]
MRLQEKLLTGWPDKVTAGLRRDYSVVCGIYEDEADYTVAVIRSAGEPAAVRKIKKEAARESFARFISGLGLKPEEIAGAVMLPEMALLDSYEEQLGDLGEKELPGAARWSLMTRETIMERQVWWTATPVNNEENLSGVYRIEAISREDGERGLTLLRSIGVEPMAVFVMGRRADRGTDGYEAGYRIAVPELTEPVTADEAPKSSPAELAACLLWADLGRGLPMNCTFGGKELAEGAAMNFLPLEERPELYRWQQAAAVVLVVWLICLGGFFFRVQLEVTAARTALSSEETLLKRQDTGGTERRQMMAAEKRIMTLEREAVRLTAERRAVSPTLQALGALTPVGIRLTELTGQPEGTILIKGETRSSKQVKDFIETFRRRMNPAAIKLKSISEAKSPASGRGTKQEFVIILGEEKQP